MGVEELPTVEEIHAIHELIEEQWDLSHRGTRAVLPDRTLELILDDVRTLDGEYRRAAALVNRLVDAQSTRMATNGPPGRWPKPILTRPDTRLPRPMRTPSESS